MILAPNEMKAEPDERKAGKICLETIKLDPDWYRIGHTKARNFINDPPHHHLQMFSKQNEREDLKRSISDGRLSKSGFCP